ncbi:TPA: helix-turn-helix transcriptional regulator [Escherichia coli]|uniref:helix-turn-helix transcriptional regulator n=1 Tax=Escherichia coli TaxID=562 RepID=UPI000A35A3C4|nr:helix-turn-helix transcriptional regulator [Escherichia coli]RCC30130.1 AraC family transcriptional regulator [Escherichia coli]RCC67676.1 AraC family transcriptional regulator [Escherichia coli]HAJ5058551.1 helix-turn-helix domain-containing protein [Escherichia coli]HCK1711870.1 helix-turn-helix transcriptional regulator [Escherichia coli]HCL7425025.1 helix-turn-helix transcriptional regulator [Escherichia coli]
MRKVDAFESSDENNTCNSLLGIKIKNIVTQKHLLVYMRMCDMHIYTNKECLSFKKGDVIFIERGLRFNCEIKKHDKKSPPLQFVDIDTVTLNYLKDITHSLYGYKADEKQLSRCLADKIIGVNTNEYYVRLFNLISNATDNKIKAIKIAYLISKLEARDKLIFSLRVSSAISFGDKIKNLIQDDLSKKWRLNLIADKFNVSEVTIRKRLKSENTSFNNLILDLRMNKALQLLHENEKQIHQISKLIGISNPSYFIKMFKDYFGVTPKQYTLYFRIN